MRDYQPDFSSKSDAMFDKDGRQKKAITMVKVLEDYLDSPMESLSVINIGGSAGIIDEYLSRHFKQVTSVDIDEKAVAYAAEHFQKPNLKFEIGDAMNLNFPDDSFDVAICSQVYEHVPDAKKMIDEIYRVLKPDGVVYFAAGNRIMLKEPHYGLPFLSILPRPLAHFYVRACRKGSHYYEKHYTYWGLKSLVRDFQVFDYTSKTIEHADKFGTSYMIKPGTTKHKIAAFLARNLIYFVPGYIWILKKNEPQN